jgi:polyhydroxyalkanoate synthase
MHSFYIRNMYLDNLLREPGGITLDGVAIDIRDIDIPVYFLSTHDDHIAPWAATYRGARLFSGPVRFVVGGSGHIAGVINPPQNNKYGFRVNDDIRGELPPDPDEWQSGAAQCEGSWWPDWISWIGGISRRQVAARVPGSGALSVIEDAPGAYVRQRID